MKLGQLIIFLVLTAFVVSSFMPALLGEQNRSSVELSLEDMQDTTDAEDELEDQDEFKGKESPHYERLIVSVHIALTIAHQIEIFSSHHPSVITPPPRG